MNVAEQIGVLFQAIIKLAKRVAVIETIMKANKIGSPTQWRIESCEGDNSGNMQGATFVDDHLLGRSEEQGPRHPLYQRR